tara:strand:+ start:25568 stop:26104 length:537 start_codon:yes stop_codon:yes gene_type:complete
MPDKTLTPKEERALRRETRKNKVSFKERTGKSRVSTFLETIGGVAPDILDIAGKLTGLGSIGSILSGKIKDTDSMSETDKQLALRELEIDMVEMQELTKRLQSDNEHTITRLVRPVSYGFVLLILAFIMFFDGNIKGFTIQPSYIPVVQYLAGLMTMFYFGSRGAEKMMKMYSDGKGE